MKFFTAARTCAPPSGGQSMVRPWGVPTLNFRGLPPSMQGSAGLGARPPEDAGVGDALNMAPLWAVPRANMPNTDSRRITSANLAARLHGERCWPVPRLDLHGIPASLQGCAGLGAPPPEDPVAGQWIGHYVDGFFGSTSQTFLTLGSSSAELVAVGEDAFDKLRESHAPQTGVVPRLNLRGLRPSYQGCFGLGMLPPEEFEATTAGPSIGRSIQAGASGVQGNSRGSAILPRTVSTSVPAVPRLDLWGIPVSLQGWVGFAVRRPATEEPISRVPPLNLRGLPPPQSYTIWPGLARFWWAVSDQHDQVTAPPQPSRAPVVLPALPWSPEVGCVQCAICLADFEVRCSVSRLPCGHVFHADCINQWVVAQAHCPLCRCVC